MDVSALFNPGLYSITCLKIINLDIRKPFLNRLEGHCESLEKQSHMTVMSYKGL
jgi:hypothetical protein